MLPPTYTEPAITADLQIPMMRRPCDTCIHAEPVADWIFVVWCDKHAGHVPAGATCSSWAPPPDAS